MRFLLPEERLNAEDDEEFEVLNGNHRVVMMQKRGIKIWAHYNLIPNEVNGCPVNWQVNYYILLNYTRNNPNNVNSDFGILRNFEEPGP